ncbi:TPA: hypothetical protein ACH3X3_001211 [Trebouxia sp. C0006]
MVSEKAGQEPRPDSLDIPSHKCCLGTLYYSQSIHDKGRNPVCAGIRSKHLTSSDLAQLPPESIPAGEFKVVMATETQRSPMLQTEANQEAADQQAPERQTPLTARKTYTGAQQEHNVGGVNLGDLSERFIKTSGKIVDKMGSNLGQIATTAKQAADKVGEQIWGKGRDH